MIVTVALLRAAGLTEVQINRVTELADAEAVAERRAKWRVLKQNQRSRPQMSTCPVDKVDIPLSLVSKKETLSKERKGVRGKPLLVPLPDDWEPKGPQRDPTEADEFRNKARAKGWVYANWDAAYRNYQNHPDYNHRNKSGVVLPSVRPTM